LLPIIDSCLPNNTLKLATERTTLDFDLRKDKIKRADLLQTSRETGIDSLSSGRRLQCVPEGKHKTRRAALRHATANSSIDLLLSNQSSQPYYTAIGIKQFQFHITFQFIEKHKSVTSISNVFGITEI